MHRADGYSEAMFTRARLGDSVPADHSLRVNYMLKRIDPLFTRMCTCEAMHGRPRVTLKSSHA
jgi:hypothetical protein